MSIRENSGASLRAVACIFARVPRFNFSGPKTQFLEVRMPLVGSLGRVAHVEVYVETFM